MSRYYFIVAAGLLAAALGLSLWFNPSLPQRVPTHWNLEGKVDGWGDKWVALWLMPGVIAGMFVLFQVLPALSPKQFEVDSFRSTYLFIMVLVMMLFAYLHAVILLATWQEVRGGEKFVDIGRALLAGMFLFFAFMGNVMGKVRKNFYIGIRVPWTLASDRVWNDTHRLAAWIMVGMGVVGFVLVLAGASLLVAIGLMVVSMLVPVVYSFVHYKALERRGAL